jgi:serine/threonine-protein phosphatase 6 regulatory subunit 3
MFWECHIVTSSIDKLLDQPTDEIKLQDFLDENDLIQECLNQNPRLLDYLVQTNVMNELIHHVITLPKDDNFRNANIISELLSGDFQRIQETLLEQEHLEFLYTFLSSTDNETLNPILASFFARIINTLIIRRPNEIIKFLKSREKFKDEFLHHLDSTSITDILYRLISDSGEQRSNTIQWYEDMNLIDGLIQQFLITESKSVQINITNLLSEFLRLAFDQQVGIDCDIAGPTLSATIERLLYGRNENNAGLFLYGRSYQIDPELEPDGFFASGPVRPASKFVRSGPVEIWPDHF